jgi:hypothetical protein
MSNEERQLFDDIMTLTINGSVQEKLAELMGILRKNVDSDVQARLKLLEKENAELRKYRDNVEEMRRKTREMELIMANAELNAKKARLKELVAPFTVPAWTVEGKWEYIHEKCDLCDASRLRHFTSPGGRAMSEPCQCAKQKYIHRVEEIRLVDVCVSMNSDRHIWFRYATSSSCDDEELHCVQLYSGEEFKPYASWLFLDRDKAQEYADWLDGTSKE